MADNDYICVYRQFFEEFARSSKTEESRPIRVNVYNLSTDELLGEVMNTCVNYLTERKCPRSLVVPLTKIVVEEFINEAKKQPEEVNTPLKLNCKTHDKISEVCLRYTDNEKLSSLPGPVEETYYSTHSTKHTRRRMEDRHICLPRFNSLHGIQSHSEAGYYGIFDGHGGVNAACYAVSHLQQFLAESEFYPNDPVQAFRQAFEKTESRYSAKDDTSGTAVLAILHQPAEKKLTVAWVGDSQAMLVSEDSYVMLVDPHRPARTDERKRIEALQGFIIKVQNVDRVNGGLAISRALGDKPYKPFVSAEPEIRVINLTGSEHFVVMGCDGLWDVVEPQQVIETVYFELKNHGGQIETVSRRIVDLAKENNSTDNISVIVIFLTDPAEICNRSVDVTGHRPKVILQNGVIMDASFQPSDKSPLNDPGMNGIYEANGNHFDDHLKNESDEDFGPETNVDAIDDVLASPKSANPFGKECWSKLQAGDDTNMDKLIEFSRQETMNIGDEIMKFSDEFVGSQVTEDKQTNEAISDAIRLDKFSVDSMNPFEGAVPNNTGDVLNFSNNGTDNKYVEEINSRKEDVDNFMNSNFIEQSVVDVKNEANLMDEPQEPKIGNDPFSFESNLGSEPTSDPEQFQNNSNDLFCNEAAKPAVAEDIQKESAPELESTKPVTEALSPEPTGLDPFKPGMDELSGLTFQTRDEPALNPPAESVPLDASGNPPVLCSVIDALEAEKMSTGYPTDVNVPGKEEGATPELLSPSAPATDGEAKDEVVGESGGEVEDSEDDEWNYIKVESGGRIPGDRDLVASPDDASPIEKPAMNSPLNPNAAEFVPVAPIPAKEEVGTPIKALPQDLADIVSSSPNWSNMEKVSVPEESAFLNEIKSRPSNIFENFESPHENEPNVGQFEVGEAPQMDTNINLASPGEMEKENEFGATAPPEEVHGIALATDMTSSFIDTSTMSVPEDCPNLDFVTSPIAEPTFEKKDISLNDTIPQTEQFGDFGTEPVSKLPDLLSPVSTQDQVSPVSPAPETPKSTGVEAPVSPATDPVTSDLVSETQEIKSIDPSPVTQTPPPTPMASEAPAPPAEVVPETLEKLSVEEKSNATVLPEVAAGAAVAGAAVAAVAAAAKKDVKKPATAKPAPGKTAKAPATTKPLVNGTKTSAPATKKPTPPVTSRPSTTAKPTTAAAPRTAAPRVANTTKTPPKPATTAAATANKVPARPKPATATATAAPRVSSVTKTTVTSSATKPATTATAKPAPRNPGVTAAAPKPKPRVPSAPVKSAPLLNGDVKSTVKRTEVAAKKPTTTTTSVSMSTRPATAPSKPTTLRTTMTTATTRTVTAKPRAPLSTTSTTTVTSTTRVSPTTRKSMPGSDKQAKEIANRITSKTSSTAKTNGVVQGKTTTTLVKTTTRKTTTTTTPSKTKNDNKTETKAETILDQKVELIQSENGTPSMDTTKDINLINSIASE